jgi:hypothetical protein
MLAVIVLSHERMVLSFTIPADPHTLERDVERDIVEE